jgi:hypothetical protein
MHGRSLAILGQVKVPKAQLVSAMVAGPSQGRFRGVGLGEAFHFVGQQGVRGPVLVQANSDWAPSDEGLDIGLAQLPFELRARRVPEPALCVIGDEDGVHPRFDGLSDLRLKGAAQLGYDLCEKGIDEGPWLGGTPSARGITAAKARD